jgi:3-hydroxy-9,10-secoandrosta-1,3,5(10)-triene-9,17-dione monooxygenase reductase component
MVNNEMTTNQTVDPISLREALGSFATGITIVTTLGSGAEDIGLTANSFNSVSLTPPMVLWSLSKTSHSQPAFAAAEYFAVHILAVDQEPLSNLFSKRGADKFSGLKTDRGYGGIPLLKDCAARFQCRTAFRYDGGDHDIFVGEVVEFEHFEKAPLIFHRGKYGIVAEKNPSEDTSPQNDGSFSKNFLGFLLGQAHFKLFDAIRQELLRLNISLDQYFALCALGTGEMRSAEELNEMGRFYDRAFKPDAALDLLARGMIGCEACSVENPRLYLTQEGRRLMIELLAIGKGAEATAQQDFDCSEAQLLRSLLKRLVHGGSRLAIPDRPGVS